MQFADAQITNLAELLRLVRLSALKGVHVSMPGIITAYSSGTHTATVQPLLLHREEGASDVLPLKPIPDVPVIHPRTLKAAMVLPVAKGDLVTLVFSDEDLGSWKSSAGIPAEPKTARLHSLADCYALLGGYPKALPFVGGTPTDALSLWAAPGVKIFIGTTGVDLFNLLDQTLTALKLAFTALGADANVQSSTAAAGSAAVVSLNLIQVALGLMKP